MPRAAVQQQLVTVRCNIHAWMLAYAFVLDHPFAAVTDENGEFHIPSAPLGKELRIVAWHEAAAPNYFLKGGEDGDAITLQEIQPKLSFTVKGK